MKEQRIMHLAKIAKPVFVTLSVTLASCIPAKIVTLISAEGNQYLGKIDYSDAFSGVLSIEHGPLGESFLGRYTAIDKTAVGQANGTMVVPSNRMPAVGVSNATSSGSIDATGYWYAIGNRGSTMQCHLDLGRLGHGQGTCRHSDGHVYQIIM
jgi:hypothetical protein